MLSLVAGKLPIPLDSLANGLGEVKPEALTDVVDFCVKKGRRFSVQKVHTIQ